MRHGRGANPVGCLLLVILTLFVLVLVIVGDSKPLVVLEAPR